MATRFNVRVPPDRRVTINVPAEIAPGMAEVIILRRQTTSARSEKPLTKIKDHPAFGLWAKRAETADPIAFVDELRRRVMEKRTAR